MSDVFFHVEGADVPETVHEGSIRKWLDKIFEKEGFQMGILNIVFCSDDYLSKINFQHLNHEDLTDIISFDYSENLKISGDLFVSIERVKENSFFYNHKEENELLRVLAHGVLHLLGYKDKTLKEKKIMRKKENECLFLV